MRPMNTKDILLSPRLLLIVCRARRRSSGLGCCKKFNLISKTLSPGYYGRCRGVEFVLRIFIYAPLGGRAIIIRIECVSGGCRGLRKVRTLVVSA